MKNREIMDKFMIEKTLKRIAHEIIEKNDNLSESVIVGIKRRGEPLAERLSKYIEKFSGIKIPVGSMDITLYRDDLSVIDYHPIVRGTELNFDINGKTIFLIDDVLFTGRTVRSALDELVDFGRPSAIRLVVLIDRGNRELPIRADYVGREIETYFNQRVEVKLTEIDGEDRVLLIEGDK